MSGAGADAMVRVFIALALPCGDAGRPVRWLVIIAGEVFSSVASAKNSNATSTEPTTAKKARTGIGAFRRYSERHTIQDHQAQKNGRERQAKHLCRPMLTCTEHLCSCALTCICHDSIPIRRSFVIRRETLECGEAVTPAYGGSGQPS